MLAHNAPAGCSKTLSFKEELMQRKLSGPHTITAQESIMLMDEKLCGDEESKSRGNRALPQHTMEPLTSSVEELAPDCTKAQAPLQPANMPVGAQTPQATDKAVSPSAQSSRNLYIKAAKTPGGHLLSHSSWTDSAY
jgi:hypothetical protein